VTFSRSRFRLVLSLLGVWCAVVVVRLVQVQVVESPDWAAEAARQQEQTVPLDAPRGDILSRDGRVLAGTLERIAVYANPRKIPREKWGQLAQRLAPLVGQPAAAVQRELAAHPGFFYLAKDLDPAVAEQVARLDQRGVGTLRLERREYPHGSFAGPVIGFVDADGSGKAGVEAFYDRTLAGVPAVYRILRDGKRFPTPLDLTLERPGRAGLSIRLTLDTRAQYILEEELERTREQVHAHSAVGVVMAARSGELLALASLPAYDPARVGASPPAAWHNRAVEAVFEPGSVFKPFIVAAALSAGVLQPLELVDCSGGGVQVAGTFIRDHARYGWLPVRQVLAKSSNAGAIRIAYRVPPHQLDEILRSLGFGTPTGVELPAEARGLYRPVEKWQAVSRAGLAIGQEVSVTPLQIARAYAAIANGGLLVTPRLVLETRDRAGNVVTPAHPEEPRRVLSEEVTAVLREMLAAVVEEGTGRAAAVNGVRTAGKTGTAQKAIGGSYAAGEHVAWFAGFFPLPNPQVVVVVCIDQPQSQFWAADVAAPVFGRVVARLAPLLGIRPSGGERA
jgi:cell division protein FtsI (penicillin-binding protein 3)